MYLQAKIFVGEVIANAKTLSYDIVKGFCGMVKGFQVIELMGSVLNKGEMQAMRQTGGQGWSVARSSRLCQEFMYYSKRKPLEIYTYEKVLVLFMLSKILFLRYYL